VHAATRSRRGWRLRRERFARRVPCASTSSALVMPIGFHRLSNRGKVIAAGKLTPTPGTISMDLTIIDLGLTTALGPGDEVTQLSA